MTNSERAVEGRNGLGFMDVSPFPKERKLTGLIQNIRSDEKKHANWLPLTHTKENFFQGLLFCKPTFVSPIRECEENVFQLCII